MNPLKILKTVEPLPFFNYFNSSLAERTWLTIRWNFTKRKGTRNNNSNDNKHILSQWNHLFVFQWDKTTLIWRLHMYLGMYVSDCENKRLFSSFCFWCSCYYWWLIIQGMQKDHHICFIERFICFNIVSITLQLYKFELSKFSTEIENYIVYTQLSLLSISQSICHCIHSILFTVLVIILFICCGS